MLNATASTLNLAEKVEEIVRRGPTRVVVARECYATTPDLALREYGIVPDVVFVRDDGWSLGAPAHLRTVARRLWAKDWIAEFNV